MDAAKIVEARAALLAWYGEHRRDLAWRRTSDPYAIWISEIMLQQTRVAAAEGHYERFMKRFPTVVALALAELDDVLAHWSGLGYYRRARMLHRAAQVIVSEYGGKLPQDVVTLRSVPGIGPYTSAAIASIAYGLPLAVVDGNVERVLARLEGEGEQRGAVKWQRLAQSWLDEDHPGEWNQAMMELGALVCLPRGPRCLECPVYTWCETRGEHVVGKRPPMRSKEVAYAMVERTKLRKWQVLLEQRHDSAKVMPGLWELPLLEALPQAEPSLTLRHAITNTNYYVRIFRMRAWQTPLRAKGSRRLWVDEEGLEEMPLTGLTRKVMRRLGKLRA
jgi:A/G-specific adenine glycosylase